MNRTTRNKKTGFLYAIGILCAFCLMLVFLITAVEAVAYWTPGYYEKEYTKYQVLRDLPEMTMEDLLAVTDEMMAFLRGNREDLHVFTTMGGEHREFFNAREIAHMEDVRTLFIGGLWIRRIGLLITAVCAASLWLWKDSRAYRKKNSFHCHSLFPLYGNRSIFYCGSCSHWNHIHGFFQIFYYFSPYFLQ